MRTLNESFADDEWELLQEAKKRRGMNWHDFIMNCCVCDEMRLKQNWKGFEEVKTE